MAEESKTTTATVFEFDESKIEYMRNNFLKPMRFKFILASRLPMGFLSGMRVEEMTAETCKVSVPYKWINKNPFKSTFWAVLGMAAEMSSGALLLSYTFGQKPSIATLVVGNSAQYSKKAIGRTTFVCNSGLDIRNAVKAAVETGEPQVVECPMIGYNEQGEEVAKFSFTWSMKARSKKK